MPKQSEQTAIQALAPFLTNANGRDPATLGAPGDYPPPWGLVVSGLQAGASAGDLAALLAPDALQAIIAADPDADPLDATRAQLAQRWRLLDAAALLQPPTPPTYLVGSMIRRPSLVTVYGAPGSLKSMLLMDLAVCVAGGVTWLDPQPGRGTDGAYQVEQGPALWVDCDNGENRLKERFGALMRSHGLSQQSPIYTIPIPAPIIDVSNLADLGLLIAQIQCVGARLCVIDNLGNVSGGADENASDMVRVMANLRLLAEQTGAAIFVIHHARKGGSNGGREGDRLRGHSSIEASLDLALLIEREAVGDHITVQSTKTRDNPVKAFEAVWAYDHDAQGALLKGRFYHVREVEPKRPEYVTIAQSIPDMLKDADGGKMIQTALREAIQKEHDCGDATARKAIEYAEAHRLVMAEKQGAHKSAPKVYRAASAYDKATQVQEPIEL